MKLFKKSADQTQLPTLEEVIEKYGAFTNHNIQLPNGQYTISADNLAGSEVKVRRMLQIFSDLGKKPISEMRILDLACLEGMYGIEMAMQGANVISVEGRPQNIAKAKFVADSLGLENIKFEQDDVRNVTKEKYGEFDAILNLGIYYHLDAPDIFSYIYNLYEACTDLMILDTNVSKTDEEQFEYNGHTYRGSRFVEHEEGRSQQDKIQDVWASLDNPNSALLSRASLYNLLNDAGFSSIYECHQPVVTRFEELREANDRDRATFVCMKRPKQSIKTAPMLESHNVRYKESY